MRLACHCATNLAKDLEELLAKNENCTNKIDFDIKNFIINFCISSLEDLCLYNLRLNVEPGAYYQLPIPFKIDQNDLDEPFEPNYAKLSKLLEEKCFENGSMKNIFIIFDTRQC
ncbi:hypothetical protein BpHYR1_047244 [Brachionus plicatilis]|uniref:Uncharacterized protein n=1 Tax=Brachionus plicatilis TaxID=10195 RepID=A0A3M7Q3T6_BRAPC|nr:hypothetical protein BpHYR1_047244 [Brachionus plicatilis]